MDFNNLAKNLMENASLSSQEDYYVRHFARPNYPSWDPYGMFTNVAKGAMFQDYQRGQNWFNDIVMTPGIDIAAQIGPVYHGSPYKFSKFENKAIGTGEGAQAFGHGHYLTESPEVAKSYSMANAVKLGNLEVSPKSMWFNPLQRAIKGEQGWNEGTLIKALEEAVGNWGIDSRIGKESNNILQKIKFGEKPIPSGHQYETTIHKGKQPSEYTYLEWDKPVTKELVNRIHQQAKKEGIKMDVTRLMRKDYTQGDLYNSIATQFIREPIPEGMTKAYSRDQLASMFLNRIGYSGIKYPTGSLSGIKGSKEYNYVVFNPEDITIESILPPGIQKR